MGGNGIRPDSWLPIRYPLTETIELQRAGQSAAMMFAVRAPQSKPASVAFSMLSASISVTMSTATAAGWPLRKALPDRNRVEP